MYEERQNHLPSEVLNTRAQSLIKCLVSLGLVFSNCSSEITVETMSQGDSISCISNHLEACKYSGSTSYLFPFSLSDLVCFVLLHPDFIS